MIQRKSRVKKTWKRSGDIHIKSLKNPFFKAKKSFFSMIPYSFLSFILFIFNFTLISYFLLYGPFFKIRHIEVYGVDFELTQNIREIIGNQLRTYRFLIIPQDTKFSFDKKNATLKIMDLFTYQNLYIDLQDDRILIMVQEKEGALKWAHKNQTYLLSQNGIILRALPEYKPTHELINEKENKVMYSLLLEKDQKPLLYDLSEQTIKVGDELVNESFIETILFLYTYFEEEIGMPIGSVEMLTSRANSIRLNLSKNWYVIMSLGTQEEIKKSILRLKTLLREKLKNDTVYLQYIDLRAGEKIFYK